MDRTRPSPRAIMAPSRLGGVPAALPPPGEMPPGQLALPLVTRTATDDERAQTRHREVLRGAVHVAGWLGIDAQRDLVLQFRRWALPPAGLRQPRVPSGHLMSVRSVCLGWHWYPYVYSKTADDSDGAPVKALPREIADLARAAVAEAYGTESAEAARYAPDAAIVNLYAPESRLGLHQDAEEPSEAPVVTISLGDTCVFRFAGVERRTGPFVDIELRSGDLLVFGGPTRRIYHGVTKVLASTAPDGLGLPPGRLSITVRETGLQDSTRAVPSRERPSAAGRPCPE
jgi:alkylated DNA repair protein (DNA oxidative demethylase)